MTATLLAASPSPAMAPVYPYIWRWRARLPERFGQDCRATARGALNSVRVEFPDGFWVITARWAVRCRTTAVDA